MIECGLLKFELTDNTSNINTELIDNTETIIVDLAENPLSKDKTYLHTQSEASSEWVITHNLNKYPSVTIINSAGDEVIGDVTYNSVNQVTVTFAGAFKGTATLN